MLPRITHTHTLFLACYLTMIACGGLSAATRTATVSGAWATSSTWSGNTVPTCGDSIIIPAGITITMTTQENLNVTGCTRMAVVVYGNWYFDNGKKIDLPCGSRVYIMTGGALWGDTGGSSNQVTICGNVYWRQSDGTITGPSTLPVVLMYFRGRNCLNEVCLEWKTASEKNNGYFEVSRSSDGISYSAVGTVSSKAENGNSDADLYYTINDPAPAAGISYYRLLQVDANGAVAGANTIAFVNEIIHDESIAIAPNPSNGSFVVKSELKGIPTGIQVQIVDFGGVVQFEAVYAPEEQDVLVNSGLKSGIYFCTVTHGSVSTHSKLAIQ
jgi:hypothetical protein